MTYNWLAKNYGQDFIYRNRIKLFHKLKIDKNKSPKVYSYYMAAVMGIILQ